MCRNCEDKFSIDKTSRGAYYINQREGEQKAIPKPREKLAESRCHMAEKMTRKQALEFAIANLENTEVTEVLSKMLESISKPRAKQVSKARIGNENLAHKLWDASEGAITTKDATEKGIPEIMTTQKAAAVLRVGVELGLFEKVTEGKKVTYHKIG